MDETPGYNKATYLAERYEQDMRLGPNNSLQIILKVAERCNIACKYCYFFFGGDESYKDNPAYISADTCQAFARFVADAVAKYNVELVRVIIHGGEPLMLKRERMDALMSDLKVAAGPAELQLTIQTNGMLIDEAWVDLFARHQVYVGISLDGPAAANDANRIDKRMRGTYDRSVAGIRKVFEAYRDGRLARPGLLCVVNPDLTPPDELYDHFVADLGFRNIDFLLPDDNHDSMPAERAERFAVFMDRLFVRYASEKRPDVQIRFFDKIVNALTMAPFFAAELHRYYAQRDVVFTVSSAGDIAPDDILRTCDPELMQLGLNVKHHTLRDVLVHPRLSELNDHLHTIPSACRSCEWANVCRGGDIYHRYSKSAGFDNRSIYCRTLIAVHERAAEVACKGGMPLEQLADRLVAVPCEAI